MENAKANVKGVDIYNVAQRVKTLLVNKDENATAAFPYSVGHLNTVLVLPYLGIII